MGCFCSTPSVPLVRNLPIKQAMEMLLTGDFIDAQTAQAQGLVNRVVAAPSLDVELDKLVRPSCKNPRPQFGWARPCSTAQREMGLEAAYQLAGQTMALNMMDADAQEGAQAFAEKRLPAWRDPS